MKFGGGLKRSTPHRIAHRLGAHQHPKIAAALAAGPKGSAMLVAPDVLDQGPSGTCHAHSAAAGVWCAFAAASRQLSFVPSPKQIASCTYADVRSRAVAPGQPLPPLQDTGAELQDDADAMRAWGVCPIRAPTPDGRYSDVGPNTNPFPEPDTTQLQQAATNLIDGEYAITVDGNAPRTVAACLDAGIPVWVGFFVDSALENMGAHDVAQPPNENDPSGGGHAVFIRGYRTNASGQFEYIVRNSWGSGFAADGDFWASEAWIKACWDLWPLSVAA